MAAPMQGRRFVDLGVSQEHCWQTLMQIAKISAAIPLNTSVRQLESTAAARGVPGK